MQKLKPCPFCGAPAEVKTKLTDRYYSHCECTECHATTPTQTGERSTAAEECAAQLWNKRKN